MGAAGIAIADGQALTLTMESKGKERFAITDATGTRLEEREHAFEVGALEDGLVELELEA